ncbi:MAG TPA: AsmA-like C-terminal region-containing protein, partial [Gammaproteobacteria bacterium]|nr:AsmA-like C-terminal region-containing protein [Gammaproteobacteria bacterium]
VFELDRGNAYTNSLLMNGPSARIDISGRTGLADQDYDQRVTVTPALSNTIPVASALFGPAGIGVGAVIYLGQKMFKSIPEQVDKFLSREYSITGPWEQPVIERI